MNERKEGIHYMSVTEARKNLKKVLDMVKGEDNQDAVVLIRQSKETAVVVGIDWYRGLLVMRDRAIEAWDDPEKLLRKTKAYERKMQGDMTGTIDLNPEDFDDQKRMDKHVEAFEKAEKLLVKKLTTHDWFEGVVPNGKEFVVFISPLGETHKHLVSKSVTVDGYTFEVSVRISDGESLFDSSSVPQEKERLRYLRRKEEEDFQLAKEKLEKDYSEFEWFRGIKRREYRIIVVVSDKEQAEPFVDGHINVPFGAKVTRHDFLVDIEELCEEQP